MRGADIRLGLAVVASPLEIGADQTPDLLKKLQESLRGCKSLDLACRRSVLSRLKDFSNTLLQKTMLPAPMIATFAISGSPS